MNDNLGAARRFGSPDVIVAVVDSGVDPNHPQFNGNVSNGQPKVFTAFNFVNMVANNNSLAGSHGTCCASAAAGFTNVNSGTAGVPDGTVGIAGNCRVMGIRRGGTELDYADMYIWIGGFNPNSARVGFPAQLTRGADIITNSFGYSIGVAISGLMRDTFDHLTTYGRAGKGILLFFSAGNQGGGGCSGAISTLLRPWGSYGKCMSVSASTLANDGVTEVLAQFSNFGPRISFCAPSNSDCSGTHNPPTVYGAWTGTILNNGNAPRNRQILTTLNAAANTGNNNITVTSIAGMTNQAIIIGNPSANISPSEAKRITGIPGSISILPSLFANKANGTVVNYGNRDYRNNFGGTSYATPVIAGVAALMLSVNNRLTWIEVREILRGTATKIDPTNTNAVGRWIDVNGLNSGQVGYLGPFFSQFYGYGRINAAAAVQEALDYTHTRDIFVRDNMADDGSTTTTPPHWQGADIWVNNAGLVPANYATHANTVHEPPTFGQANLLHVRYKNRGTATSFPFYVRAYLVHFPGTEFIYPDNFIPSVRPNGIIPNPLTPGTYLIGEQLINPLAAGAEGYVTFNWPANLVPPQTVLVGGVNVNWHPCLLAEVSPHDGFVPTGNNVWDNNNLAQKNIHIIYPDDNSDNAAMVILGNTFRKKLRNLKCKIFSEPAFRVPYFICFTNKEVNEIFIHKIAPDIKGAKPGRLKNYPEFGYMISNPFPLNCRMSDYLQLSLVWADKKPLKKL
ncbi:MAG: S8 family serine peptidase [Saprospiraceae bacterium]|nr:S8 family serine peptidase [Saprospiraceae bacterium]